MTWARERMHMWVGHEEHISIFTRRSKIACSDALIHCWVFYGKRWARNSASCCWRLGVTFGDRRCYCQGSSRRGVWLCRDSCTVSSWCGEGRHHMARIRTSSHGNARGRCGGVDRSKRRTGASANAQQIGIALAEGISSCFPLRGRGSAAGVASPISPPQL